MNKRPDVPMEIDIESLCGAARKAASRSYSPLSKYRVGAALLCSDGAIFLGTNIEFDNYSNTIHAEEAAIAGMIVAGKSSPKAIAVYTVGPDVSFPCGMCRQSLYELGGEDLQVIACTEFKREIKSMGELMPYGFRLER